MTDTIIRASSLPSYPDCSLRWAATTMRKEIKGLGWELRDLPQNIGAANGTAVHAAAANALTTKKDTGELGKVDDAIEVGVESLQAPRPVSLRSRGIKTTPEMSVAQQQVDPPDAALSRQGRSRRSSQLPSRSISRPRSRTGFVLSGHVDVTEEFDLHDLKTGKMRRINSQQYGAYALLRRSHGGNANKLIEDYVQRVSPRSPQPDPIRVVYDGARAERMAMATIKKVISDVRAFKESKDPNSFMANPNSFLCGDKFCPAWGTSFCGFWAEK